MVARMLIAALLAASSVGAAAAPVAGAPAASGQRSSMTIVAEARATISNPVALQSGTIDTRAIGTLPIREPPRQRRQPGPRLSADRLRSYLKQWT
jgi:hypothetical protein